MITGLVLPQPLRTQILAEARRTFPRECCGLVEGRREFDVVLADAVHPTRNTASRSDRFEIDPAEHFALLHAARERGREIVACFHSHPNGGPSPSAFDTQNADEDDLLWLVASLTAQTAELRAFVFGGRAFHPVPLLDAAPT